MFVFICFLIKTQAHYVVSFFEGRRRAAEEVERYVVERLVQLGMPAARLQVEIVPVAQLRPDGADEIRFLFTANRNMALQPIEKVASGGELSRIMLCLKDIMARYTGMPTMVFDEIDTGVSGSIADKMGEVIDDMGRNMQVFAITHLPQIAVKGKTHLLVYKEVKNGRSVTGIRQLEGEERVMEVARMLSGSVLSDAAIENARFLLNTEFVYLL